jgi:hypothetical protein
MGIEMDSGALNELVAQVRITAAMLVEAEQRVAAFTAELARQKLPDAGAALLKATPVRERASFGWLPANKWAESDARLRGFPSTGFVADGLFDLLLGLSERGIVLEDSPTGIAHLVTGAWKNPFLQAVVRMACATGRYSGTNALDLGQFDKK